MSKSRELLDLILDISDLLRGSYLRGQYSRVLLPLLALRRFDCLLERSKDAVLARYSQYEGESDAPLDSILNKIAGQCYHNRSPLNFKALAADPDNIQPNLVSYINGFSANIREIMGSFNLEREIERMRERNILFLVIRALSGIDLRSEIIDEIEMGSLFEQLLRGFNEKAGESIGEHVTPRDVIDLMVQVLFVRDEHLLFDTDITARRLFDPTCGTGGMLTGARRYLHEKGYRARLAVYGQDINQLSCAFAATSLLLQAKRDDCKDAVIELGDSLVNDRFHSEKFDYFLATPPIGLGWKNHQKQIYREFEQAGFGGRFGAGLPRSSDSSLLFLQHLISKFQSVDAAQGQTGSRLAIVFGGAPLLFGGAGSGESAIRKWIIENDWLETVIALPEHIFFNTGVGTYIWIVTNRKETPRKQKIQLIDARGLGKPLRPSRGRKRRELSQSHIAQIMHEYDGFSDTSTSKIVANDELGFSRVTVERPLRLQFQITAERKERFLSACPELLDDMRSISERLGTDLHLDWNVVWEEVESMLEKRGSKWRNPQIRVFRDVFTETSAKGEAVVVRRSNDVIELEADPRLRDYENVPLGENIESYCERHVRAHAHDAWIDQGKTKVAYEIDFERYFRPATVMRPLPVIDAELKRLEREIVELLSQLSGDN